MSDKANMQQNVWFLILIIYVFSIGTFENMHIGCAINSCLVLGSSPAPPHSLVLNEGYSCAPALLPFSVQMCKYE